jgi:hypothetical protein
MLAFEPSNQLGIEGHRYSAGKQAACPLSHGKRHDGRLLGGWGGSGGSGGGGGGGGC